MPGGANGLTPRGRRPDRLLEALEQQLTAEQAEKVVLKLIEKASSGDQKAIELIWERLVGKPQGRAETGDCELSLEQARRVLRVDDGRDAD